MDETRDNQAFDGGGNGHAWQDEGALESAGAGGYPATVKALIDELSKLPGIGRRSADRLAFHLLKGSLDDALRLSKAIEAMKRRVRHCSVCCALTDRDPCRICADPRRDASVVMVVEQPRDQVALEATGMFRGVYHVLMGRISPLDQVGPEDLTVGDLLARVKDPSRNARGEAVAEVVLALNPTLEGDSTALYLAQELRGVSSEQPIRVTRLARGVPTGAPLELANKAVLADAIEHRAPMG